METEYVLVTMETKEISIRYKYTNKTIAFPWLKPIANDASKAHMLSLGIRKIQFLDVSCYVMDMLLL